MRDFVSLKRMAGVGPVYTMTDSCLGNKIDNYESLYFSPGKNKKLNEFWRNNGKY